MKRELASESALPAKKNRLEKDVGQHVERKFKKRKLEAVLEELCMRVENNDRQLTNNLIRELDSEHVRVVSDENYAKSCSMMLKACLAAKTDTIARKVFNCLIGMFARGTHQMRTDFVISLEEDSISEALFSKNTLDIDILRIYILVLNDRVITPEQVPEKVRLCARRCLAHSSLAATANRTIAIEFHVALAVSEPKLDLKKLEECENLLCRLADDRDYRVRKAAADGLLSLSQLEVEFDLQKSTYKVAKSLVKDCDSTVRITAIGLLIYFANRPALLLADDAFSEICDAMNDMEIAVRVEAAKKLGDFEAVSEDLLYQTLDKKMMRSTSNAQVVKVQQSLFALSKKSAVNNDRRWKFARKAHKPQEARGGWSRGKELNAVCPEVGEEEKKEKEKEEEEESIIPHGACGAFVSALEDEFMDVRKAAVYSLGRLAANRPTFAVSALEYLADMFNDEIADVRLDAINALTPLIAHGQLNAEQLNVILKCLDDAMPESRQAMRELLRRAQFADVNCIEMCVKALLACLKRFGRDKEQVFACFADIGRNHAVQVQSIMRSLLDIHLIFHTREPSIEDEEYVGKLIMVLNAASEQSSMVYVMPEFVHRHYRFLRSSFPALIRPIRVLDEQQSGKIRKAEESNEKAEEIVLKTYSRLCEGIKREEILRDTWAIARYNENVSGAARLIFCLGEVAAAVDNAAHTVLRGGELVDVKQLIAQNMEAMLSIEHQFSGISDAIREYLVHCRLYLSFLDMLVWLLTTMAPQSEIIAAAGAILGTFENAQNCPPFFEECQALFVPISVDEKRKIITPGTLVALLNRSAPILPPKLPPVASLHLKFAKITHPNKDAAVEQVLRFFANLPHAIQLEFELHNMSEDVLDSVRVKIIQPDGRFDVMKPRREEMRREERHFFVSTQARVTCAAPWSEPAEIDIVVGVMTSSGTFVPFFSSPSCHSSAHVRVRIHPHSR